MKQKRVLTIIQFDVETSADREKHHLASLVSMIAPHIALLDAISPENAFYGEWYMLFCLSESQITALVRDPWKLHQEASFWK
jgi:hypothetical protein